MDEEKICPINPHGNGYCKFEKCALWDQERKRCAFLNISEMMTDIRFHVKQLDMQGIGVYNQDDGI